MARGNARGNFRGRGGPSNRRGGGGGAFGRGGNRGGNFSRGGRGGGPRNFNNAGGGYNNGPPMGGGYGGGYDDYYDYGPSNYGPPMLPPPIPPQRLPMPPVPPVPPRSLMRGMPPSRRPPPYGGYGPPVPPLPPPRPRFSPYMGGPGRGGRGRGGRILKSKNTINGGVFKKTYNAKKAAEKLQSQEIKKPWVTPELEAEIKKKYELFIKIKEAPNDQEAQTAYKDQTGVVMKLNAELRTKYTKGEELSKPWVGESLKTEIEKKYQLYEDAKEKKDDEAAWTAFKEQKALVSTMFTAARTEYLTNTPEEDLTKMDENFAVDIKLNGI